MDFSFDEAQLELRALLQRFLRAHASDRKVRELMQSPLGYDPKIWNQLAAELGATGLAVPERFGGAGRSCVDVTVVCEELGSTLACVPYLSSVGMATPLLVAVPNDPVAVDLLPRIVDGSALATVALADPEGAWDDAQPSVRAVEAGGGWVLTGEKRHVLDGNVADVILVGAATRAGLTVFAVESGAHGLDVLPVDVLDRTRRQSTVTFDRAHAQPVGMLGTGVAQLSAVRDMAAVLLAAEQVGGAQRLLDEVVSYVKVRYQFGRPVGSFQAVKHKCAEMLLSVESARSAAYYASASAARGDPDFPALASLAKAYCSDMYVEVATTSIQLFGGIGFTWDHFAHLYFRRATSSKQLLGDPSMHRELLAQRLGV